jgi:hypothetical protein
MNLLRAIRNFALRVATVALIGGVSFLVLLALHLLGVPLHSDPVIQIIAFAAMTAWRLYRVSTSLEEIMRFLDIGSGRVLRHDQCARYGLTTVGGVREPSGLARRAFEEISTVNC